jgi:hypothetical protein
MDHEPSHEPSEHPFQPALRPEDLAPASNEREPSAERAAQRIDAWYRLLGPRLGAYLTDPNIVLTLADARPQTELFIEDPEPTDTEAFARLNEHATGQGIRFHLSPNSNRPTQLIGVESLAGLQHATAATKFPGIPKFDPASGWAGFDAWNDEAQTSVQAAARRGEYPAEIDPNDQVQLHTIQEGIRKGYPDEAILFVARTLREPNPLPNARKTQVPYADYYQNARPNYSYDVNDETVITRHTAKWGHLLEQYYHSDTHRRLEADDDFRRARTWADEH